MEYRLDELFDLQMGSSILDNGLKWQHRYLYTHIANVYCYYIKWL